MDGGQQKTPVSSLLHEGCALVYLISQAPTRRPTTSVPEVIIALDGSLRTGQTSNPGGCGALGIAASDRCHDACMATDPAEEPETAPPVVINISPMAHFAVGFFALGLLVPVLTWPLTAPLLIVPVLLSALIIRLRTQADDNGVTVRTLLGSQSVRWDEIDGLRFRRSSWARAQLKSGRELRLPAVTFATLPLLTRASAGRVPNPYAD